MVLYQAIHNQNFKKFTTGILLCAGVFLSGCTSTPPGTPPFNQNYGNQYGQNTQNVDQENFDNLCLIYERHPDWETAANASYQKWGTPPWIILAMVHQESRFKANARPADTSSGAFGFAQATDAAWYDYQKHTNQWDAKRNHLKDALDFMGWYNNESNKRLGISKNDPFKLYLAYHEGHTGYQNRSYLNEKWLPPVAKKVAERARLYARQAQQCR